MATHILTYKTDHMTVGELANFLAHPTKLHASAATSASAHVAVVLDGARTVELYLHSYRGDSSDGALPPANIGDPNWDASNRGVIVPPTAKQLSSNLSSRIGSTMDGYKGGTYDISADTKLWISSPGEASEAKLVGVSVHADEHSSVAYAVLLTEFVAFR